MMSGYQKVSKGQVLVELPQVSPLGMVLVHRRLACVDSGSDMELAWILNV